MRRLKVTHSGRTLWIEPHETLGFGRSCTTTDASVGWGYPGRFVELGPEPDVHRLWGDLVPRDNAWIVRSLGSLNPLTVVPDGRAPHRLAPFTDHRREEGLDADSIMITSGSFRIEFPAGRGVEPLSCEIVGDAEPEFVPLPAIGRETTNLADRLAGDITRTEYLVLWAMAADRREGRGDRPVSYSRIVRRLHLESQRQAVAAVERLTRRFREFDLLGDDVRPENQRQVMCERAIDLGLFARLEARFGPAE